MGTQLETTGSGAALNATPIPLRDASQFGSVAVSIAGAFVATITFEASNDNVNWVPAALTPVGGGAAVTSVTAAGLWEGVCPYRFFRGRISAYTSGTATGIAEWDTTTVSSPTSATQAGPITIGAAPTVGAHANAWNAAAVAINGNSTAVDCQYVSVISAFGNANAATTIKVFASQDNANFYDTGLQQVLAGAADFSINTNTIGARYVRLLSTAAATVTATIAGKD